MWLWGLKAMRSNIVDLAGGTFVVTAMSYATGIAYYNALFRGLNGKPELFTVPLEKILFEGGRQLAYIAFEPVIWLSALIMIAVIAYGIAHRFGYSVPPSWVSGFSGMPGWKVVKGLSWAYLFVFMAIITSYAFSSGKTAGEQYAKQASCVKATLKSDAGEFAGCVVYKTDSEIWLAIKEGQKTVLLNIPSDKYTALRVF